MKDRCSLPVNTTASTTEWEMTQDTGVHIFADLFFYFNPQRLCSGGKCKDVIGSTSVFEEPPRPGNRTSSASRRVLSPPEVGRVNEVRRLIFRPDPCDVGRKTIPKEVNISRFFFFFYGFFLCVNPGNVGHYRWDRDRSSGCPGLTWV